MRTPLGSRANHSRNDPYKRPQTLTAETALCLASISSNKSQSYDLLCSANSAEIICHQIIPLHSAGIRERITGLASCLVAEKVTQRLCGHQIIVRECIELRKQRTVRRNFDLHQKPSAAGGHGGALQGKTAVVQNDATCNSRIQSMSRGAYLVAEHRQSEFGVAGLQFSERVDEILMYYSHRKSRDFQNT